MMLQMVISLYTARVVLNVLGIEDFGTYTVISGVVALFQIVNSTLRNATSRFITFEVGKGSIESINKVFSMSMIIYIFLVLIVILVGETIGLWFVNNNLKFPVNRINAVFWVYQMSLLILCVEMLKVPYESIIISNERFNFFALIGILDSVLRLVAIYTLTLISKDKLITYSILLSVVSLNSFFLYKYASNKISVASKFKLLWNKAIANEVLSFTGWNIIGSFAQVFSTQGVNILINMFLGVTVNAAVGIANQVSGSIYQLVSNFQVVFNPQITKSIACNQITETISLIYKTTKISYFLLLIITIPLYFSLSFLLSKWLGLVPSYTLEFSRYLLIFSLIDALAGPLYMTSLAIGKIRTYQIYISSIVFLNFIITFIMLRSDMPVVSIFIVKVLLNFVAYVYRIIYLRQRLEMNILKYFKIVCLPIFYVTCISFAISFFLSKIFQIDKWSGIILFCFTSLIITSLTTYFSGFDKSEKLFLKQLINLKIYNSI